MDLFRICPRCAEENDARFLACRQCGATLCRVPLATLVDGHPAPVSLKAPSSPPKAVPPAPAPAPPPPVEPVPPAPRPVPAPARRPPPAPAPLPARGGASRNPPPGPPACLHCGKAMREGTVDLATDFWRELFHGGLWLELFHGGSWRELFFRSSGLPGPISLLKPRQKRVAFRCSDCGGLWLDGTPPVRRRGSS